MDNTGAVYSCSVILEGKMLIFGGDGWGPHSDQISQVDNCALRRIGTLPMRFYYGGCATLQVETSDEEYALLCFDDYARKDCHR